MSLLERALSLPEEKRGGWLKEVCGDSTELLRSVNERLQWEERMGDFLLAPPVIPPSPPGPSEDELFICGEVAADRFEIVREIARGGMAVVYEALDRKTRQTIALKCPKPPFQKRLLSELRSALRVTHPNICRLYEIHSAKTRSGQIDFLTMEYLEGETLGQRLRQGPIAREEAARIVRQLCAGLGEAHARDIVHGDLKPSNVILTPGAGGGVRAVITDFGLARNLGLAAEGSALGSSLRGTPDYIAPELWRGETPSPASDIYALGVMLHELLLNSVPRPGAEVAPKPEIPRRWREAITRCLAESPTARPQRAALVEAAFRPARSWAPAYAAGALILASIGGVVLTQRRGPDVPDVVRLAILPAQTDSTTAVIGSGAAYDVSDRLQAVNENRKRMVVIPLAASEGAHITGVDAWRSLLGATHVLILRWRMAEAGYDVAGEVYETSANRKIGSFDQRYDDAALGALPETIAATLSAALRRKIWLGGDAMATAAYRPYAEGLHFLREAKDPGRARASFEKATALPGRHGLIDLRMAEADMLDFAGTHSAAVLAHAVSVLNHAGYNGGYNDGSQPADAASAILLASIKVAPNPEQGPAIYRSALRAFPQSGELWRSLAEALRQTGGASAETAAAYRRAIVLEPGYFRPWVDFGVFSFYEGCYANARDQFAQAAELAPGLAKPHQDLAHALLVIGDYTTAEQEYRQALNIQRDADTLMGIGALLAYQGRHSQSVYYYEQAAALSPEDSLTLSNLADSYRRTGRVEESRITYRRVVDAAARRLAVKPNSAVDRAFQGYALSRIQMPATALAATRAAVASAPGNVLVRRMATMAFEVLGLRDEALDQIQAVPVLTRELGRQPDLAALRQSPRFQEMSRQFEQSGKDKCH